MSLTWIRRASAVVLPVAAAAGFSFMYRARKLEREASEEKRNLTTLSRLLSDHMDSGVQRDQFLKEFKKRLDDLQSRDEKMRNLTMLSRLVSDHMESGVLRDQLLEELSKRLDDLQSPDEKMERVEDPKSLWESIVSKVFGKK